MESLQIILALGLALLSCGIGLGISKYVPWSEQARRLRTDLAVGIALGPFVLGLTTIATMKLLPGVGPEAHLLSMAAFLALTFFLLLRKRIEKGGVSYHLPSFTRFEQICFATLGIVSLTLFFVSFMGPVTQNDTLEYAIVGSMLFDSSTLASYPAIFPDQGSSGFYGPWTHPPLYVSLIYLGFAIQGNNETLLLMQAIAPWFALSGAIVVFSLASSHSKLAGVFAAMLYLIAPLHFLGVQSGLLDALPMAAFGIVIAAITGIESLAVKRGLYIGIVVGVSLWTHSEAILFLPMAVAASAIYHGLAGVKKAALEATVLVCIASIVGGEHYYQNWQVLGKIVSDSPAVFEIPELAWDAYFSTGRGIDGLTSKIQYGLFKGWFSYEAYGAVFWFMTLWLLQQGRSASKNGAFKIFGGGLKWIDHREMVPFLCFYLVCVYLLGVLLSMAIGLDLLIKNERYMLAILPVVSVLAGISIASAIPNENVFGVLSRGKRMAWRSAQFAIVVVVLGQVGVLMSYKLMTENWAFNDQSEPSIKYVPEFKPIFYLNELEATDSKVLTLKPSDMFYSQWRMLSYLDPQLAGFYSTSDMESAHRQLTMLGVKYVHIPDYTLPVFTNGPLQEILRNPDLSSLLFEGGGYQIYELAGNGTAVAGSQELLSEQVEWQRSLNWLVGGRKELASLPLTRDIQSLNAEGRLASESSAPWGLFNREFSVTLQSEFYELSDGEAEYAFDLVVNGRGYVRVWLMQCFEEQGVCETSRRNGTKRLLGDWSFSSDKAVKFGRRFNTLAGAQRMAILIEHVGNSLVEVQKADIVRFEIPR